MVFKAAFLVAFSLSCLNGLTGTVKSDTRFAAPGVGAEGLLINDDGDAAILLYGAPDRTAEFEGERDLWRDVFNVERPFPLLFSMIYYFESKKTAVFILNGKIKAVAGFNNFRVTPEGVDLRNGAGYFVFSYGNSNLTVMAKSDDKKTDKIYIYSSRGIALFDDGNDDAVDMFIVFQPSLR